MIKDSIITLHKKMIYEKFFLKSPTSVAAMRGTKFYTFTVGDIQGICFCEGTVEHTLTQNKKNLINNKDYLLIYRGQKSTIVTADDIRKAGCVPNHNYSVLEISPLGKKNSMSPEQAKRFFQLLDNKLKQ